MTFNDSTLKVPTSVMPKGVEHIRRTHWTTASTTVPTSVMPKGVEHLAGGGYHFAFTWSAHLCDAERR